MKFYSLGQLSNSERADILNKHKEIYDGYRRVWQPVSNEQPLYVQDFANDKEGLVVTNKGDIKKYTNVGINEQWQFLAADALASEIAGAELAPLISPTIQKKLDDVGEKIKSAFSGIKSPTSLEKSEMTEINIKDLQKGKKYKYKTPSFEDEVEWESEQDYLVGEKMYGFKGEKASHGMGKKHIEDYIEDIESKDEFEDIYDIKDMTSQENFEDIYDVKDINPKAKFDYIEEDFEDFTSAFSDKIEEEVGGPLYSEVKPAYSFVSDGPLSEEGLEEMFYDTSSWDDDLFYEKLPDYSEDKGKERYSAFDKIRMGADIEDIDWEDVDDDIKESFLIQKNKINEMFDRFSKYN